MKVAFLILFLPFIFSCVFLPKNTGAESDSCDLKFNKYRLSGNNEHSELLQSELDRFSGCIGALCSGAVPATLAAAIATPGSLIVSGSLVVVGNTAHWLEQQGKCEESFINTKKEELKQAFSPDEYKD